MSKFEVGDRVAYRSYPEAREEYGTVTEQGGRPGSVRVKYDGENIGKLTSISDLRRVRV